MQSLDNLMFHACMQPLAYWTYLQIRNTLKSSRSRSNQTMPVPVHVPNTNVLSIFTFVWVETLNENQFCPGQQWIQNMPVISDESVLDLKKCQHSNHRWAIRPANGIDRQIIKRRKKEGNWRGRGKVDKRTQSNFEFRIVDDNSRCCR